MRLARYAAVTLAVLMAGSANAQLPVDRARAAAVPVRTEVVNLSGPTSAVTATPVDVTAVASTSVTYEIGNATLTNTLVTNGPIADTPENRARYGQPNSSAGKRTAAKDN